MIFGYYLRQTIKPNINKFTNKNVGKISTALDVHTSDININNKHDISGPPKSGFNS